MFVVVGNTTADLFVRGMPALAGLADGVRSDNLVFCEEPLLLLLGGNAGISSFGLARLGVEAALCSAVGQDDLGGWVAEKLAAQGVNISGLVRHLELATASSTILLDRADSQAIFHHWGASEALTVIATHKELAARAEVLLATGYPLSPRMRAGGFAELLELTREGGGTTALDIGPAVAEPARTPEIAVLFPQLDYLIGNEHELMVCTETVNWEEAAAGLLEAGCRNVVVKRGAGGSSFRSREVSLDVPSFEVPARISVGAGDLFNAGFLFALWKRRPIREALRFGNAVAALAVAGDRGVFSAPSVTEVEGFLDRYPEI